MGPYPTKSSLSFLFGAIKYNYTYCWSRTPVIVNLFTLSKTQNKRHLVKQKTNNILQTTLRFKGENKAI